MATKTFSPSSMENTGSPTHGPGPIQQLDALNGLLNAAVDGTSADEDDHESSIASYMASLLERSRTGRGPNDSAPPVPSMQPIRPVPKTPTPMPPTPPTTATTASESAEPAREVRRQPPPERRDDLVNMRELANTNARHAIEKHSAARKLRWTRDQAIVAGAALVASSGLAIIARSVFSITFGGALAALAIGAYFGARYWLAIQDIRRDYNLNSLDDDEQDEEFSPVETVE